MQKETAMRTRAPDHRRIVKRRHLVAAALGAAIGSLSVSFPHSPDATPPVRSAIADPAWLLERYESWKASLPPDQRLAFRLVRAGARADTDARLTGLVRMDEDRLQVSGSIAGWDASGPPILWAFMDGENGAYRRVGAFDPDAHTPGAWSLRGRVDGVVERWIVAPEGGSPWTDARLVATTSLFERVYAKEGALPRGAVSLGLAASAVADDSQSVENLFTDLVAEGERIFFNETFNGNGRTCGTCHPAENNFTLDRAFIARLSRNDPLFVADFVPALRFGDPQNLDARGRPQRFENPVLLREHGLILENVDGTDDLEARFAMRAVTHTIGMRVSIASPLGPSSTPTQRTGWAGDGAPIGPVGGIVTTGSLRDFTVGAIRQHFPKTLARSFSGPRPDFRAPTPRELDAVEAFTLSIGRQRELELQDGLPGSLRLRNPSAEAGRILFRDGSPAGSFSCNGCHENAGANVRLNGVPVNLNFNTGVELFLRNRRNDPRVTVPGQPRPVDGGFGINPAGGFDVLQAQPGFTNENFGNQEFNTISVVESADTPPFFHNNIVSTLEDSVRFYNSPEFIASIGVGIAFDEVQVMDVANFMRAINALDNIESSALRLSRRALQALRQRPVPSNVVLRALEVAVADTDDAIEVLRQGRLHSAGPVQGNAVLQLEIARDLLRSGQRAPTPLLQAILIAQAVQRYERTIAILRF
jgi:cytochrome c peroxidase